MVRSMRQAAHAIAIHRVAGGGAREQCQRRREQREDDENGLGAAHREKGYHSLIHFVFAAVRASGEPSSGESLPWKGHEGRLGLLCCLLN